MQRERFACLHYKFRYSLERDVGRSLGLGDSAERIGSGRGAYQLVVAPQEKANVSQITSDRNPGATDRAVLCMYQPTNA